MTVPGLAAVMFLGRLFHTSLETGPTTAPPPSAASDWNSTPAAANASRRGRDKPSATESPMRTTRLGPDEPRFAAEAGPSDPEDGSVSVECAVQAVVRRISAPARRG